MWLVTLLAALTPPPLAAPAGSAQLSPLHRAALEGDPVAVTSLLADGASANAVNAKHSTPLHLAALHGRAEAAAALLDGGADANAENADGNTPLHAAAASGHAELVELMVRRGAAVSAAASDGQQPLHLSAWRGHAAAAAALIEGGASVDAATEGGTALHLASAAGHAAVVALLLERGAAADAIVGEGESPLAAAVAEGGGTEVMRLLLDGGAIVDAPTALGETPLHAAAAKGDDEALALLLERCGGVEGGPPPPIAERPDREGDSLLHAACRSAAAVELLLRHGARADTRNAAGETPLHMAAWAGAHDSVRALCAGGASVDARGAPGETPLHCAAQRGHVRAMRELLAHGATADSDSDECAVRASVERADFGLVWKLLRVGGARKRVAFRTMGRLLVGSLPRVPRRAPASGAALPPGTGLSDEWASAALRMPPLERRLLVLSEPAAAISADELLKERGDLIGKRSAFVRLTSASVLRRPAAVSARGCAALRRAVDSDASATRADTVDGLPDHQVYLGLDEIRELLGDGEAEALCRLPLALREGVGVETPDDYRLLYAFARKYTAAGRPWFGLHQDEAALTVNVALSDDRQTTGGRLVGLFGGGVQEVVREEGEATVHSSSLVHGVTRVTAGVRYSLIMFWARALGSDRS